MVRVLVSRKCLVCLLAILVVVTTSCVSDSEQREQDKYPYKSELERIKGELSDNFPSLTRSYVQMLAVVDKHGSSDASDELSMEIVARLDKLQGKALEEKNYELLITISNTLESIGHKNPAVSIEVCYREALNALSKTADKYTIRELKDDMVVRGLMKEKEVATLLNEYQQERSPDLYQYYLNRYTKLYPGLTLKYSHLANQGGVSAKATTLDFENLMKSVVTVLLDKGITSKGMDVSVGTGFAIDANGYILTNHHVIADHVNPKYEGYSAVTVTFRDDPDKEYSAMVIGWDKIYDIALLKVIGRKTPDYLSLGISADAKVGDKIYTIGNPIGIRYTLTSGIISNREIPIFQMGQAFQIDAAINPGNSGGPLMDDRGQVVGVVFAGIPQFAGISFAIPFEWVRQTIPLLYAGKEVKRSWLGAGLYEVRDAKRLVFYYTLPGGGADIAGIQDGDELLQINGEQIRSIAQAQSLVAWKKMGSIIEVLINRRGEKKKLLVRLDSRPQVPMAQIFKKDSQANIAKLVLGLDLSLTGRMFGVKSYRIEKIIKGLPGYKLDISEGNPVSIYALKYMIKEKAVMVGLRYTNKDVSILERFISLALPAEVNNLL